MIPKSANRLSFLFRFKDIISKELESHIVYKFSCKNERHFNVRSSEDIGISHLTGKSICIFRSSFNA